MKVLDKKRLVSPPSERVYLGREATVSDERFPSVGRGRLNAHQYSSRGSGPPP